MEMKNWNVLFTAMILAMSVSACSHKQVAEAPRMEIHAIHHFIPYTMKVRRPLSSGANPKVGPGGVDYTSHPLPDAHFDCDAPASLFKDVKLDEAIACFESVKESSPVRYQLRRAAQPELVLEENKATPACLKKTLPKIAVPREIFFQSTEEGSPICYSSRLDIEANDTAGFKMPTHRLALRVDLPLAHLPENADEMRMLLLSWALTPLWEKDRSSLPSHVVPDALCGVCLGPDKLLKPTDPPPVLWPE
jgi:hypothetical protein